MQAGGYAKLIDEQKVEYEVGKSEKGLYENNVIPLK